MKTAIIELLNKIANGEEPPKKIVYDGFVYIYDESQKDYKHIGLNDWLLDDYVITDILNDEVEILETTITLQTNVNNCKQDDKIEKLKIITKKTECGHNHHYLVNDKIEYRLREVDKIILDKINEIIDKITKEEK